MERDATEAATPGGEPLPEPMPVPTPELNADLRAAVARLYSRFRSERAPGEIAEAAVFVLTLLRKHGPLTLTELSERARVTPGSMSQTVNRLTAEGYAVRRRDSSDGRRVLFVITDSGTAIADASRQHRESWLSARLDALTPAQRRVLAEASQILRDIADS
ncbi:MarR family winged helix-turn-helix transcriptional regulator [Micromonospora sp. NPDC002575]|uniref:MarR family winged helix-turn-helix transcriptional regulator n=1 Tax=Micromonospora sp. NPDC002575 TaxID=3364222 RepID=UPI0036C68E88